MSHALVPCWVASSITAWAVLGGYCWYCFLWRRHHGSTWPGWNTRFLTRTRSKVFFVQHAVPAMVAAALEEFQVESIALMAAKLGPAQISAHNATLTLFMLLSSINYGALDATTYVHCAIPLHPVPWALLAAAMAHSRHQCSPCFQL